jgi:hypothetical protein
MLGGGSKGQDRGGFGELSTKKQARLEWKHKKQQVGRNLLH